MKWQERPQSENVLIDCLGLQAPLNDDAASKAALACQAEVDALRDTYVSSGRTFGWISPDFQFNTILKTFLFDESRRSTEADESPVDLIDRGSGSTAQDGRGSLAELIGERLERLQNALPEYWTTQEDVLRHRTLPPWTPPHAVFFAE